MKTDFIEKIQMVSSIENIRLFYNTHKEFSKDKNYRIFNLIKALLLVSKYEKIIKFQNKYIFSSFLPPIPSKAFTQLFNAVPKGKSKFESHTMAERTAPISIFIAITEKCNYSCWHCSKAKRGTENDLSLEIIIKTIKDLQEMGTAIIGLTGGEPLLRDDLEDIVSSIDSCSTSYIYTTGNTLTQERAKKLKEAGLFGIGISLDHYEESTYDKLRGYNGAFKSALKAIDFSKKAGLYTMIQMVATKKSIYNGDIWKMIEFAKKLKVHELRILEVMPTGRLINIDSQEILTLKERNCLIEIQKKANSKFFYPKVTTFAQTESFEQFGCGAGTQHSYIDSNGNLCPCDFVPLSFGNIKNEPVKAIWEKMNAEIKVPRKICLIQEIHGEVKKMHNNKLPLDTKESKVICEKCEKMKSFPGFYSALRGKK